MKIPCPCGHFVIDGAEDNPQKFVMIPFIELQAYQEGLAEALKNPPDADHVEAEIMRVVYRAGQVPLGRLAWQCATCQRLFINTESNKLSVYELRKSLL